LIEALPVGLHPVGVAVDGAAGTGQIMSSEGANLLIEDAVALDQVGAFRTAVVREELVSLSDFWSRTHPESDPVGAT
jgi:hypothetical protein